MATDFDFIAYMSKIASFFFLEAFFTPLAFLGYDNTISMGKTMDLFYDIMSVAHDRIRQDKEQNDPFD